MERSVRGPFVVKSSKLIYKNPWIALREDAVIRPDGKEGIFGVIEMKAGSSVLPLDEFGNVFLACEYKYAIDRKSVEVFSGGIDGDESPLQAAKRELEEELGMVGENWTDMGCVDPFTTVIKSPNYIFLVRELKTTRPKKDAGEEIDVLRVPFGEALEMVKSGKITHAASCVVILKASEYIK